MKPNRLRRMFNFYGPYFGAGVKVETISPDWRYCRVSMNLRWYNKNAVSTHFGGSLYSMVDPHYMLLLMKCLGRDYTIWDKAAHIDFQRPGKGYVWAEFKVTEEMLESIRVKTENGEKYLPTYEVQIKDAEGKVVCTVQKTLYIRKKPQDGVRI